jgi:alcohol dehydrogenase
LRAIHFDKRVRCLTDYPDPTPGDGECLVQVHMAGICSTDLEITQGYMNFTGVLGHEMVGSVVAGPTAWTGKRVACEINCVCGKCDMCRSGLTTHCRSRTVMGIAGRDGCFADLVTVPVRNLHEIPDAVSDEAAVFVEPLAAAYQVIKQCPIDARMQVAVVGSGRLGLLVAQVLATTGCRLIVVGRNPKTLEFCEKRQIQSISVNDLVPRKDHDVVVECTGVPAGMEIALGLVRPRGTIMLKSTYADSSALNLAPIVIDEIRVIGSRCGPLPDAIHALARDQIDVSMMIARAYKIERGPDALEAAGDPNNIKVLLKINSR